MITSWTLIIALHVSLEGGYERLVYEQVIPFTKEAECLEAAKSHNTAFENARRQSSLPQYRFAYCQKNVKEAQP